MIVAYVEWCARSAWANSAAGALPPENLPTRAGAGAKRRPTVRRNLPLMEVSAEVTTLLADAGVRFAYLFGSRATGRHRPDSDADLAVLIERPLTLMAEARLSVDLARALGVPAVDLVDLRRAPLRLLGRILGEGRVIHGRDDAARVEFEVVTRGRYFDFLPRQREHQEAYLRHVAAEGMGG